MKSTVDLIYENSHVGFAIRDLLFLFVVIDSIFTLDF
jgi:hypothetical protein